MSKIAPRSAIVHARKVEQHEHLTRWLRDGVSTALCRTVTSKPTRTGAQQEHAQSWRAGAVVAARAEFPSGGDQYRHICNSRWPRLCRHSTGPEGGSVTPNVTRVVVGR